MIVFVNQKVADFDAWKKAFVADAPARRAAGVADERVFAVLGRPQAIMLELEIADADKAIAYLASAFPAAMRRAGALGKPEFLWTAAVDPADLVAAATLGDSDVRAAA
jgi:hypothetical protein